ncbi:hypothetical protein EKO23_12425 [Nocardioides guangzhouensis]|uniref:Polysaccharide chain length determinant N-terminal domain-containing protein n=1 Tax=Nocardioides guangzhouensis TaxID=2497878 RepID=A0A4Q4ZEB2_9ACTN|nr:Wzz/FepE/Etk N-terminal domain-containing protein [Nocardioides guangzhouensis]RYP85554.1 hypothetical protein EKO23_12425 [Nocardioides guangzhouensis]
MGEQVVDLRSALTILRRRRAVLAGAALVGAAMGVGLVLDNPPMYSSTTQVLLPPAQDANGQSIERDVATEIRVASSEAVLRPAGAHLSPVLGARAMSRQVDVMAASKDVLEFTAEADNPGRAESMANAVAAAMVAYVQDAASSLSNAEKAGLQERQQTLEKSLTTVNAEIEKALARKRTTNPLSAAGRADAAALGQLTAEQANLSLQIDRVKDQLSGSGVTADAQVIQSATPAARPSAVVRFGVPAFISAMAVMGLASAVIVALARRDQRLRLRDELADALGTTVVGSLHARVPTNVAGWASLLGNYAPSTVDAWSIRQTLRQVMGRGRTDAQAAEGSEGAIKHPDSLTVISLSEDMKGLSMGPQLASYVASVGVETRLVAAQSHESAAALWAACGHLIGGEVRPGLTVDTHDRDDDEAELTVVLAVVDRRDPELLELPRTAATVLAVSAGSATADDLARLAVVADDAGYWIDGIVVADPDNLDRTTGRLLAGERAQQAALPMRLTGLPGGATSHRGSKRRSEQDPSKVAGSVSDLRRRRKR